MRTRRGVIHRDLKPSNILVSVHQGEALPKIIDFGVARATDHRLVEATIFTEEGQMIGTPALHESRAGPRCRHRDIDTRTDIYFAGRDPLPACLSANSLSPPPTYAGSGCWRFSA